ncbi:MAG: biotin-dependent carboxyltransferase [Anaerolineales bacterium]|nr:biotin-dependent carboxyltransferase [Anaerolineales bacterium]
MLEVLEISGFATFQDLGRRGFQSFGVPISGAMDWFAYRVANYLLGNSDNDTVLEIGLGDITFRAKRDCVLAVTGAGYEVQNYLWTFPLWTSFYVRAGWAVQIKKTSGGNWAYVAIAGGFDVPKVLGSSSTYVRGGLGNAIQTGDILQIGKPSTDLTKLAARDFPVQKFMQYSQTPIVGVIAGPQRERFDHTFFENEYILSKSFDRMGYRLEGKAIESQDKSELISEGMTMGSIQIPASGQPIVMMADSPTTGGYPKIGNVIRADLPLLAQCESGKSRIRFKEISVEEAQEKYKKTSEILKTSDV